MTLFDNVMGDMITVGVLGFFIIWIISKFKKQTMKETLEDIKEFFLDNKESE